MIVRVLGTVLLALSLLSLTPWFKIGTRQDSILLGAMLADLVAILVLTPSWVFKVLAASSFVFLSVAQWIGLRRVRDAQRP